MLQSQRKVNCASQQIAPQLEQQGQVRVIRTRHSNGVGEKIRTATISNTSKTPNRFVSMSNHSRRCAKVSSITTGVKTAPPLRQPFLQMRHVNKAHRCKLFASNSVLLSCCWRLHFISDSYGCQILSFDENETNKDVGRGCFESVNIKHPDSSICLLARLTIPHAQFPPLSKPAAFTQACPRRNLAPEHTQRHAGHGATFNVKQNVRSVQLDNAAKRH